MNIGTHGSASSEHSPAKQLRELAARFFKLESALLVAILGAMIVIFTILSPSGEFFSSGNIRSIALDTSEILVLSAGEMLIIVAAGLDLSIGSVVVFSSVVGAKTLVALSGSPAQVAQFTYPHLALGITAGVAVAVLAGLGWGLVNGLLTAKWGVPPFIVTLGTLSVAVGLAQVITGGLNVPNIPPALQNSYGSGQLFGIPWLVWTAIIVVGILWVLLELTRYGLHTYAIGASPEAARRAGINVRLHTISLYGLMGLLAGIVGVMDVLQQANVGKINLAKEIAMLVERKTMPQSKARLDEATELLAKLTALADNDVQEVAVGRLTRLLGHLGVKVEALKPKKRVVKKQSVS